MRVVPNVVVTLTYGERYRQMGEITHPTMRAYADRIGAEFLVWRDIGTHEIPAYQKLELYHLLEHFERALFLDTDILVRPDAPDLFQLVPPEMIGAFEEGRYCERRIPMFEYMTKTGFPTRPWDGKYYNTGVLVVSRAHREMFAPVSSEIDCLYEQSHLNTKIADLGIPVHALHYKLNRMPCMDLTGEGSWHNRKGKDLLAEEDRFDSYFLHYAGVALRIGHAALLEMMRADWARWTEDAPAFRYRKPIAVCVEGSLSCQINAEPVVRFIVEDAHREDRVVITSAWPELFRHLGVPVYVPGGVPDTFVPVHTLRTFRRSNDVLERSLVHGVDFASLNALRQTLPRDRRRPTIVLSAADEDAVARLVGSALTALVIVHPGRGRPSKTFPRDVWQSYIDALIGRGHSVAVIGRQIGAECGVVPVDTSRCIDLVDKLGVSELAALLARAPVLLSNDAAPVHIAGAFDNWIGLIATSRHPDHVLPFRHGTQRYRSMPLEAGSLYYENQCHPIPVDGRRLDDLAPDRLRACLPDPQRVLAFVEAALADALAYRGALDA